VDVIIAKMPTLDAELFQTAIPHTIQSLNDVEGDEDKQINRPRDFTFSAIAIFNFFQGVGTEGAKPLGGRIVFANVFPFFASNALFHLNYLFPLFCICIIA